jgi:hypothetical protein
MSVLKLGWLVKCNKTTDVHSINQMENTNTLLETDIKLLNFEVCGAYNSHCPLEG